GRSVSSCFDKIEELAAVSQQLVVHVAILGIASVGTLFQRGDHPIQRYSVVTVQRSDRVSLGSDNTVTLVGTTCEAISREEVGNVLPASGDSGQEPPGTDDDLGKKDVV